MHFNLLCLLITLDPSQLPLSIDHKETDNFLEFLLKERNFYPEESVWFVSSRRCWWLQLWNNKTFSSQIKKTFLSPIASSWMRRILTQTRCRWHCSCSDFLTLSASQAPRVWKQLRVIFTDHLIAWHTDEQTDKDLCIYLSPSYDSRRLRTLSSYFTE